MARGSFFMYPDNDDEYENDNEYTISPIFNCCSILCNLFIIVWDQLTRILSILWWFFTCIYSMFGYYLIWVTLHYLAVHLYPTYCAPLTMVGFILSPFMVSAPHCMAMRWLINEGSNVIVTMWVAIGAYAIQRMLRRPNNV
jgi:hypothetical protein